MAPRNGAQLPSRTRGRTAVVGAGLATAPADAGFPPVCTSCSLMADAYQVPASLAVGEVVAYSRSTGVGASSG